MTNARITKIKRMQIGRNLFLAALCALIIYPLWMLISVSLSSEADIAEYGYLLIPKKIDLAAYKYVFSNPTAIVDAYKVTFIFSVASMVLSVLLQSMIAYPLSKRTFTARRALSFYLYFTMLFSGGMVPSYILNTRYLHLDDTIWIYILHGLVSPWNVFMMRTFFSQIPSEIGESVTVDGGSEFRIYWQFILPLSKPVLATIALLTFLGKWNSWSESMLYINNPKLYSLQFLLQEIMEKVELLQNQNVGMNVQINVADIPSETARMAMAMVVAGPALIVFPFFQKYFVKGLTVGSVKG